METQQTIAQETEYDKTLSELEESLSLIELIALERLLDINRELATQKLLNEELSKSNQAELENILIEFRATLESAEVEKITKLMQLETEEVLNYETNKNQT